MKMFLTRIGFGSKAVVTGDVSQVDLPRTQLSGLIDAERVLKRVQGIAMTRLTSADVVRHPLVARIVDAYDKTPSNRDDAKAALEAADDAVVVLATPIRKTSARSRNGS
jgi:phosphate starvation-inducible PhoH-like protein